MSRVDIFTCLGEPLYDPIEIAKPVLPLKSKGLLNSILSHRGFNKTMALLSLDR